MRNEGYLDLGKYPVTKMTVVNFLRIIVTNPIIYENGLPMIKNIIATINLGRVCSRYSYYKRCGK